MYETHIDSKCNLPRRSYAADVVLSLRPADTKSCEKEAVVTEGPTGLPLGQMRCWLAWPQLGAV